MASIYQGLVKTVARAFYPDDAVVILDALIRNNYLEDDNQARGTLEEKVKLQSKQIRRILAGLEADSLVQKQILQRTPIGGGTKVKRTYWYINYQHFVKVIRHRLYFMNKFIDDLVAIDTTNEAMYKCEICGNEFTVLQAQKLLDFITYKFKCNICDVELVDQHTTGASSSSSGGGSKNLKAKLKEFLRESRGYRMGIMELLKRADEITIPLNLPEEHLALEQGEFEKFRLEEDLEKGEAAKTAFKNRQSQLLASNAAGQRVVVALDDDEGSSSNTLKRSPEKVKTTLPAWMAISSVTGQETSNAIVDREERANKRARNDAITSGSGMPTAGVLSRSSESQVNQQYQAELERQQEIHNNDILSTENNSKTTLMRQASVSTVGEEHDVYVTVKGEQVLLREITEEHENAMTSEEYTEYIKQTQGDSDEDEVF